MITAQNLRIHEFIGLKVKVLEALSLPYRGLSGTVVDETKNTLVLRANVGAKKGEKKVETDKIVPKKGCIFQFRIPGGKTAEISGDRIMFRPYDRPKKLK